MNPEELSRLAQLTSSDDVPNARPLDPEVRSGASFTFGDLAAGAVDWPRFQVVWFYTVPPEKRVDFEANVRTYETQGDGMAQGDASYCGTYSVTISAAAPDFEYRTVWALASLADLQDLNDLLHDAPPVLRNWLDLIAKVPAMRSEIMGRTVSSMLISRS